MSSEMSYKEAEAWIRGISQKLPKEKRPLRVPCYCSDPGCPVCNGECVFGAVTVLVRIDMEDIKGTPMCQKCAENALESGLFREVKSKLRLFKPAMPR